MPHRCPTQHDQVCFNRTGALFLLSSRHDEASGWTCRPGGGFLWRTAGATLAHCRQGWRMKTWTPSLLESWLDVFAFSNKLFVWRESACNCFHMHFVKHVWVWELRRCKLKWSVCVWGCVGGCMCMCVRIRPWSNTPRHSSDHTDSLPAPAVPQIHFYSRIPPPKGPGGELCGTSAPIATHERGSRGHDITLRDKFIWSWALATCFSLSVRLIYSSDLGFHDAMNLVPPLKKFKAKKLSEVAQTAESWEPQSGDTGSLGSAGSFLPSSFLLTAALQLFTIGLISGCT